MSKFINGNIDKAEHSTWFIAYNDECELVRVTVHFNIHEEVSHVFDFRENILKACQSVEIIGYTAEFQDKRGEYHPTEDDISGWDMDVEQAIEKYTDRNQREAV